jgi:hypothetical protein
LDRVEDLTLDVPDVPRLMSLILARAIADEAVPPSFLLRLDLAKEDQGFKVRRTHISARRRTPPARITHSHTHAHSNQVATMSHDFLVNQPRAREMLADVWGGNDGDEA